MIEDSPVLESKAGLFICSDVPSVPSVPTFLKC